MSDKTIFDIIHQMDTFTNRVMINWNKMFNEDLGISHVLTLGFINRNEKARPSDISKELGLTPPTVTHLVNKLVKKELVQRKLDASDRRIIYLEITKEGEEVLKRAHVEGQELRREFFLKLSGEERKQLLNIYAKLNA